MGNLSLDDFAQSKVKHNIFKQSSAPQDIRHELNLSFEKGMIDRPLYESAIEQLENIIEKASKGEGSRGGKIIGHTSSGKPIYEHGKHSQYANFHENDHAEASYHHSRESDKYRVKKNSHETLRHIAEQDKDREGVKEHASKAKEYDEKELHHAAQSMYHSEMSRPQSVRDRYSETGKRVDAIKNK